MRVVVLGSCRFAPYQITAPATISIIDQRQAVAYKLRVLGKQKLSQKLAAPIFHSDIDACDEVWVYAPDGIGEHTQQDLDYAKSKGRTIRFIK